MARLKNDYDFLAGIYINGLYFNKYRMVIDLYTNTDDTEDQNIAFDRISYFIQEVVQRSVFVSETETKIINKYAAAGIPVLTVPAPGPFDQVVQAVLITKINAILEDMLVVTDAEINSVAGGFVTYVWDTNDGNDDIHEVVNSDDEAFWWATPDPRFVTLEADDDEDNVESIVAITWDKLGLEWYDEAADMDIEFVLEPKLSKKDNDADNKETVIKISDFNKDK